MFRLGRVLNAMNFFVCGLPGGVDYALLAAVKAKIIPVITEKRINLWLQVGIRWPGMLLCINHAIGAKLTHADRVSVGWIPLLLMGLLHGWNGLYYAQRVCGNTYVTEHVLKEAATGTDHRDTTPKSKSRAE